MLHCTSGAIEHVWCLFASILRQFRFLFVENFSLSFFLFCSISFFSFTPRQRFVLFFLFFCYIPWPLQKCGWNVSHSIRCFRFHPAPTHIHLYPCRAYKSIKAAPTNGDYIDAGNAHVTTLSLGYLPFVTEKAHCVQYETKIDEQPRKKPF